MSVVETVLVYVLAPVGVLALLGVLTIAPSMGKRPRYRSGQPWEHEPVWWSGHPGAAVVSRAGHAGPHGALELTAGTSAVGGGARGTW